MSKYVKLAGGIKKVEITRPKLDLGTRFKSSIGINKAKIKRAEIEADQRAVDLKKQQGKKNISVEEAEIQRIRADRKALDAETIGLKKGKKIVDLETNRVIDAPGTKKASAAEKAEFKNKTGEDLDVATKRIDAGEPKTQKGIFARNKWKTVSALVLAIGGTAFGIMYNNWNNERDQHCNTTASGGEVCVDDNDPLLKECIKTGREVLNDSTCSKFEQLGNFLPENIEKCFSYIHVDSDGQCYALDSSGKAEKIDAAQCLSYSKKLITNEQIPGLVASGKLSNADVKKCGKFGSPGSVFNELINSPRDCFVYSKLTGSPEEDNKAFQRKIKYPKGDHECDVLGEDGQIYSLNNEELDECTKDTKMITEPRNPNCDKFGKPGETVTSSRIKEKPGFWDYMGEELTDNPVTDFFGGLSKLFNPGNLIWIVGAILCIILLLFVVKG